MASLSTTTAGQPAPESVEPVSPVEQVIEVHFRRTGRKKHKKKRDPNAPKRPLAAFMVFSGQHRAELTVTMGTKNVSVIARELGARWRKLTDSEKAPYKEDAQKRRAVYETKLEAYQATLPKKIKKPRTAFLFYSKEKRGPLVLEHPDLKFGDIARKLGAAWRVLSLAEKSHFIRLSDRDRERYEAEKKAEAEKAEKVEIVVDNKLT